MTAAGRGSFTAAIELKKQRQLVISFLYHMAVQRNVRNPFETQEVVGASRHLTNLLHPDRALTKPYLLSIPQMVPCEQRLRRCLAWSHNVYAQGAAFDIS